MRTVPQVRILTGEGTLVKWKTLECVTRWRCGTCGSYMMGTRAGVETFVSTLYVALKHAALATDNCLGLGPN